MLQHLKDYIKTQCLFSAPERVLLAVSGGMDSVSLCHLFAEAGYHFGIAHCNFKLRGVESDGDATFVADLAKKSWCQFFIV